MICNADIKIWGDYIATCKCLSLSSGINEILGLVIVILQLPQILCYASDVLCWETKELSEANSTLQHQLRDEVE